MKTKEERLQEKKLAKDQEKADEEANMDHFCPIIKDNCKGSHCMFYGQFEYHDLDTFGCLFEWTLRDFNRLQECIIANLTDAEVHPK